MSSEGGYSPPTEWDIHFQNHLHGVIHTCVGLMWAEVGVKPVNEPSIHVWRLWQLVHPNADSVEPTKWEQSVDLKGAVSSHTHTHTTHFCTSDSSAYFSSVYVCVQNSAALVGTLLYLAAVWERENELRPSLIIKPEPSNRNYKPASGLQVLKKTCTYHVVLTVFSVLAHLSTMGGCGCEWERSQGVTPWSQWSYPYFLSGVSYYVAIAPQRHTNIWTAKAVL